MLSVCTALGPIQIKHNFWQNVMFSNENRFDLTSLNLDTFLPYGGKKA